MLPGVKHYKIIMHYINRQKQRYWVNWFCTRHRKVFMAGVSHLIFRVVLLFLGVDFISRL